MDVIQLIDAFFWQGSNLLKKKKSKGMCSDMFLSFPNTMNIWILWSLPKQTYHFWQLTRLTSLIPTDKFPYNLLITHAQIAGNV